MSSQIECDTYVVTNFHFPITVTSSYKSTVPVFEVNVKLARNLRPSLPNSFQDLIDVYYVASVLKVTVMCKSVVLLDEPGLKWANAVIYILLRMKHCAHWTEDLMRAFMKPIWSRPDELELLTFLRYGNHQSFNFTAKPSIESSLFCAYRNGAPPPTPINERIRRKSTMGTLSQFSFPACKTSGFACGSISIYALLFSKWYHPALWTYRDLDAIILNGLQKAGRYLSSRERGVSDCEHQLASLASELHLKTVDVMYHYRKDEPHQLLAALKTIEKRSTITWLLFTLMRPNATIGHHTFMYCESGIWYWFESLRCSEVTLKVSHTTLGGCVLRVFESCADLAAFAESEIDGQIWSLVEVVEGVQCKMSSDFFTRPRTIHRALPSTLEVSFKHPVLIAQDTLTNEWQIVGEIQKSVVNYFTIPFPNPFDILLKPKQTLIAQYNFPAESVVHVRNVSYETSSNQINIDPLQFINQSPYENPMIFVNTNGHPCLIGGHGSRIAFYMRKASEHANLVWKIGANPKDLFMSFTHDVRKGSDMVLIKH